MYDLHIHSRLSDGILDIQEAIDNCFCNMTAISFCDHEHIFNPMKYIRKDNKIKFISGVELCCNIQGVAIEVLGYNFHVDNKEFTNLVDNIRDIRNGLLKSILENEKMDNVRELPHNIFRKDIRKYFEEKYGEYSLGWDKYDSEYVRVCHSIPAEIVINAIKNAGGIPVLAHPMESFKGLDKSKIEKLIVDMNIGVIEMVTPKHTKEELEFIYEIAEKYRLGVSVGSDTHGQYCGNKNNNNFDLSYSGFAWIRELDIP